MQRRYTRLVTTNKDVFADQYELPSPPNDPISSLKWSDDSTRILVSSWDRNLYLYNATDKGGQLLQKYEHRAPILDCCFGPGDEIAYTVGLDYDVRRVDLKTGEQTVISSHSAGSNKVAFSREFNIVVSSSWDSTVHLHDISSDTLGLIQLPTKAFSISLTPTKLVVAMASRQNYIYELAALSLSLQQSVNKADDELDVQPWQQRESSLKFMTRCVATMPDDNGYCTSSIEGRVAVEWFDASEVSQTRKYAFKCHRQKEKNSEGLEVDVVYPVNALAFHPVQQTTFASGGGDGVVTLWDSLAKRRIRQYPKFSASVAALTFSKNGKYLAVGISHGYENGKENMLADNKIVIRELVEGEMKGKTAK